MVPSRPPLFLGCFGFFDVDNHDSGTFEIVVEAATLQEARALP